MQKKGVIFLILALIFLSSAFLLNKYQKDNFSKKEPRNEVPNNELPNEEPMVCTMEAKECLDGSFVGRKGPKCEFTKCPETINSDKKGWKTYKNYALGFEISFPENYQTVNDKYGWPNAIVLIYNGGQSYDLPIEQWTDPSEYEAKYKNLTNLTVKKINDMYITLLNINFNNEVDQIISTFKEL